MKSIAAEELARRVERGAAPFMLDVREPHEMADGVIPGSVNIPMDDVERRLRELPLDGEIVVICHMGVRSNYIARKLKALGYENVANLRGGVDAWLRLQGQQPAP